MKVNTEQLYEQGDQLRRLLHQVLEIRDEIGRTTAILQTETVGEKFVPALTAAGREVERRTWELDQLWRALHEIAWSYESCEDKVLERTEWGFLHAAIHTPVMLGPGGQLSLSLDWQPWEP